MVGVLDVLSQPVLGPVDLLTTHRNSKVLKDYPESIVLGPVVHTVEVLHGTEVSLLIKKVLLDVFLQLLQLGAVLWVLGHRQDVSKQQVMLIVQPGVLKTELGVKVNQEASLILHLLQRKCPRHKAQGPCASGGPCNQSQCS